MYEVVASGFINNQQSGASTSLRAGRGRVVFLESDLRLKIVLCTS